MNIKNLSKKDLPRERLINKGPEALTDNEILAIILRSGTKEESVLDLANHILEKYPLESLAKLDYYEICQIKGVKESKACNLLACFELVKRCYNENAAKITLRDSDYIYNYMYPILSLEKIEILYALYVDVKCHLIAKKLINKGRSYYVNFDIKEILCNAIKLDCYGVILIHNHPSGDINPSKSDVESTNEINKALRMLDIVLLDHLIVCKKGYFSFMKLGYI